MAAERLIPHPDVPTTDIGIPKLKESVMLFNENFNALESGVAGLNASVAALSDGKADADHNHDGTYASAEHEHALGDVGGLEALVETKAPLVHDHPQYLTSVPTHAHTTVEVDGLTDLLADKADATHSHTMSEVAGLAGELSMKATVTQVAEVWARMANYVTLGTAQTISGAKTFSSNLTVGSYGASTDVGSGCLEFYPASNARHGGYIDFHYNGSNADYTSRICESVDCFCIASDKDIQLEPRIVLGVHHKTNIIGDVSIKSRIGERGDGTNSGPQIVFRDRNYNIYGVVQGRDMSMIMSATDGNGQWAQLTCKITNNMPHITRPAMASDETASNSLEVPTAGWTNDKFLRKSSVGVSGGVAAYSHSHGKINSSGQLIDGQINTANRVVVTDASKNVTYDTNLSVPNLVALSSASSFTTPETGGAYLSQLTVKADSSNAGVSLSGSGHSISLGSSTLACVLSESSGSLSIVGAAGLEIYSNAGVTVIGNAANEVSLGEPPTDTADATDSDHVPTCGWVATNFFKKSGHTASSWIKTDSNGDVAVTDETPASFDSAPTGGKLVVSTNDGHVSELADAGVPEETVNIVTSVTWTAPNLVIKKKTLTIKNGIITNVSGETTTNIGTVTYNP